MIDVKVSAEWDRWTAGLNRMGPDMADAADRTFRSAGEMFFSATQTNVHVITGDLMSTGRVNTEGTGREVETTVKYGGIPGASTGQIVDYAEDEEDRGGSHAYMARGWEQTERVFAQAMPEAWEAVVRSWR